MTLEYEAYKEIYLAAHAKLEGEVQQHNAKSTTGLPAKTQDARDKITAPGDSRGLVRLNAGQ